MNKDNNLLVIIVGIFGFLLALGFLGTRAADKQLEEDIDEWFI